MPESDPRDRVLAALQGRHTVTPRWICEVCTELVPVTGTAIVEMQDVNRREMVYTTDAVSEALETLQFTLGEGPCIQAVSARRPVLVSDLHGVGHDQWPIFAEAASRTPARALYSFPLQIGVIRLGVLDLYRDQPGPLTATELAGALLCANVAFWTLLDFRADTDPDMTAPHQSGLDPQWTEIHRATRMVMTQLNVSTESALATLRAFAYSHTRPLDDIAHQIVTGRLRFPVNDQ